MILEHAKAIKEQIIIISKTNCKDVTNKVAFLYPKASTKMPPKSGPKKNPVENVVVITPERTACLPAPLSSFSNSDDSKIDALRRDRQDVNSAESPIPFKNKAVIHNVKDVGTVINGAGPINIDEAMSKVVPIRAIGIPFSILWDVSAQTNVNTDNVAPCSTNIKPKNVICNQVKNECISHDTG